MCTYFVSLDYKIDIFQNCIHVGVGEVFRNTTTLLTYFFSIEDKFVVFMSFSNQNILKK